MKVAVICEFSGTVREAFKHRGHDATSFDLLDTEIPGNHVIGDVTELPSNYWKQFDIAICHPPCTYLTYAATRHWDKPGRAKLRDQAMEFFMWCINLPIEKVCVENPVGYPNTVYRKPDQIVHPYYFGEPYQKRTCLWLKGLPALDYTNTIIENPKPMYYCQGEKCKGKAINWCEGIRGEGERSKARSRTFKGIANAMAEQWGGSK